VRNRPVSEQLTNLYTRNDGQDIRRSALVSLLSRRRVSPLDLNKRGANIGGDGTDNTRNHTPHLRVASTEGLASRWC
jgi:hypothetical protein